MHGLPDRTAELTLYAHVEYTPIPQPQWCLAQMVVDCPAGIVWISQVATVAETVAFQIPQRVLSPREKTGTRVCAVGHKALKIAICSRRVFGTHLRIG